MARRSILYFQAPRAPAAEVLVVAPLHPFPARSGSAARIGQYVRYLVERGLRVDLAVLSDAPSSEYDEEAAVRALAFCQRVLVARHPLVTSRAARLAYRAWSRTRGFRLGDWLHAPPRLVRAVRARFSRNRYRSVIVSGVQLARLAGLFHPPTLRILDAQDVWFDRYQSYASLGRGAELGNFSDPCREARLAGRFDVVMAMCTRDAAIFSEIGVTRPLMVVPFAADQEHLGDGDGDGVVEPARPPRILFIGTETSSNLDGLRFFRTRVLPAIRRQVPSCRLRVVGLAAHHLAAGPGIELAGWTECLSEEYRSAALVAVPLRMGSGLKTQLVEALAHGKAILTTTVGAQGIDLEPGRHAIVSDDPAALAREAVRVLTDDAARRALESNARDLARRRFDPKKAFEPLFSLLCQKPRPSPVSSPPRAAAAAR
jgi:glycosyltransferase involved in cell wall biosynthesis